MIKVCYLIAALPSDTMFRNTMNSNSLFSFAADVTLFSHILVVYFVVFGLFLIFAGKIRNWAWVKNPWFRLLHLLTIAVVVLQSWLGIVCPLTTLEMWFREQAGQATYSGSFITHWMQQLLYFQAPAWVFAVCYTVFGLLVLVSWFWVRPVPFVRKQNTVQSV